jgi:hypothetical protein
VGGTIYAASPPFHISTQVICTYRITPPLPPSRTVDHEQRHGTRGERWPDRLVSPTDLDAAVAMSVQRSHLEGLSYSRARSSCATASRDKVCTDEPHRDEWGMCAHQFAGS